MKSDTSTMRTAALAVMGATGLIVAWTVFAPTFANVVAKSGKIGSKLHHLLKDGISLHPDAPPADAGLPVTIRIDAGAKRHPISPLVYGVSYANEDAAALNCPVNRIGGNNMSRYNWRENADNRGQDWFFESIADTDKTPGGRTMDFVSKNNKTHTLSMVTVPTIGWVGHIRPDRSKLWSFSQLKYGPQQNAEGDAGNGRSPEDKPVTGNDPRDANVPANPAFMQPWIQQMTQKFGKSASGGVAYYLLDNEPGLWQSTHRDVMPVGIKMDDEFARSRDMALMIKSVDPTALIVGPEEWGWTGFQYSGYDSQWGANHGWGGTLPDRAAHGGMVMTPWLLQQFAQAEKTNGKRLLDIFSLHYYPQGNEFSKDVSDAMQLRRNRSTRSLWDPNYKDESWIDDAVRLVPRMKEWVRDYYPNTKIALTEYSWGADDAINGATAQADILGILGREGMDIANRWTSPGSKTPTFKAIQMFRNYDGSKGSFGDMSVDCEAPDPDAVSAFAAQDSKTGALTVMIIAKTPNVQATPVTLDLTRFRSGSDAHVYQLTSANKIEHLPDTSVVLNRSMQLTVPAQSVTLLVIPPAKK